MRRTWPALALAFALACNTMPAVDQTTPAGENMASVAPPVQTTPPVQSPPPIAAPPIPTDSDGDGLSDFYELGAYTDPFDADSDDDGVLDSEDPQPLGIPRVVLDTLWCIDEHNSLRPRYALLEDGFMYLIASDSPVFWLPGDTLYERGDGYFYDRVTEAIDSPPRLGWAVRQVVSSVQGIAAGPYWYYQIITFENGATAKIGAFTFGSGGSGLQEGDVVWDAHTDLGRQLYASDSECITFGVIE